MTVPSGDVPEIDPRRLVRILADAGWVASGGRTGLYARMAPPVEGALGARQPTVVIPLNQTAPDFSVLIDEALNTLRSMRGPSAGVGIVNRITSSPSDEFSFVKETAAPAGWINWGQGEGLITSARALLVSGAKSAREHLFYFGNRYGQFANRFLDEVMMGQTAVSSYVVRAYVPTDVEIPLSAGKDSLDGVHFGGLDVVNSRAVSLNVVSTLEATETALSEFRRNQDPQTFLDADYRLSFESVAAVRSIAVDAAESGVKVEWDQTNRPSGAKKMSTREFSFRGDQVPALERAMSALAAPEPRRQVEAVGLVHLLSRAEVAGPGVVAITTVSGVPARKIRVHMSETDYRRAIRAHDSGRYIQVRGNLEREGSLSHLYQAALLGTLGPDVAAGADETSKFGTTDDPIF